MDQHPPQKKNNRWLIFTLVMLFVVLLCCIIFFVLMLMAMVGSTGSSSDSKRALNYENVYGKETSNNKILSIPIYGVILDDADSDAELTIANISSQVTYGYQAKNILMQAAEKDDIKAVILEIKSPGGSPTGSKAITDGIEYYRKKTGKPVYSHIRVLGASAAYQSAAGTDYILVDYGSLSGSIGVIFGPFEQYDTVLAAGDISTKNGITVKYFTGGVHKDLGNPFRKIEEDEMKSIQKDIDNEYTNFVSYVASRRNISEDKIRKEVKALIYGNKRAIELGLIDGEASRDEAYAQLARKAAIEDNYQVVQVRRKGDILSAIFGLGGKSEVPAKSEGTKMCKYLCNRPVRLYGNPLDLDPGMN